MLVELVVFDLAGTTVHDDKDVPRVLQNSLAKSDVNVALESASRLMGIPKPIAIEALLKESHRGKRAIDAEWIEEIHRIFVLEMIRFYKYDSSVREKEGTSETFRKLKEKGIKIAVDTGFDRETTNPLLERMGWLKNDLIDCSVTSDEVPRGRPFPDMIFKAMALSKVFEVNQVAKVGDTASDMQQGIAAGCRWVIGVTSGAYTREELTKEKHTHLVESISEILPILGVN
jgi:phosphonatase-like hydrolase